MLDPADNSILPAIPAKRYFTIGEVSELCQVKPHVLRYWEQEFSQLNPVKRRGNRRYYQRHEVELIRKIRSLLYLEGFTISGARQKLESDDELPEQQPVAGAAPARAKVSKEVIGNLINELEELTVMLRD
jgi:DNA-binding transcriptional MerR regulator